MYIRRHLEKTIARVERVFPAVLVTGPRQVGKTTLLSEVKKGASYATLDDLIMLLNAMEEAGTFFKRMPPPRRHGLPHRGQENREPREG